MKDLQILDPLVLKDSAIQSVAPLAASFPNIIEETKIQELDTEWRLLRNTDIATGSDGTVQDFWMNVRKRKYADNSPVFPLLSKFVWSLLSLPHSSAAVERVFSSVNLMKTKTRNRLGTKTICGLLHTRRLLSGSQCYSFPINTSLTQRVTDNMSENEEN